MYIYLCIYAYYIYMYLYSYIYRLAYAVIAALHLYFCASLGAMASCWLPHPNTTVAPFRFFGLTHLKGALCAEVIRSRVTYNQNDETLRRNSLMYMSKAIYP